MQIFSMILSLLCGVALFLFGMSLMGDGLKMVAGNKLEAFLYRMTNTPIKGADEAIHQHGHTRQRPAQKHPAQTGDIKAAQLAQYVQYIIGVGDIAGNAPPDGVHLASKPCVGKPCTAPGHGLHRLCQQHGGYGAGGGGVANTHLTGSHQPVALGGKLPGQGDAPANGLHCLGAGHGRAFGKVRSPGGNAAVPHAG